MVDQNKSGYPKCQLVRPMPTGAAMCGRVFVKNTLAEMVRKFSFAHPGEIGAIDNSFPRYNGAPRLLYPIIVREDRARPTAMSVPARWGLIPRGEKDPLGGRQPINARSETVATSYMFRYAYRSQRALLPIDGFFEWKDIVGTARVSSRTPSP